MKSVLISIKPKYVNQIESGVKSYEYRTAIFKDRNVRKMLIYSSSPQKKVVAICDIENVIEGRPDNVWELTKKFSGISKSFFDSYFYNRTVAYAIKISNVHFFRNPYNLQTFNVLRAPMSFQYIEISDSQLSEFEG